MQRPPPAVYVLSEDDYDRIDSMIDALRRALDTLFERRLIEPMSRKPDDTGDFDENVETVFRDYLLGPSPF